MTFLLALLANLAFAQQKTVSGKVTSDSGEPLMGVTILVKGTQAGTSSDFDGNYSINVAEGQTLEFSSIGYKTLERVVGASNTINVSLAVSAEALEDVVLIGYGPARKISSITGSISTVQSDKLADKPVANVMEALQGQVAGLQLYTSSGEPTATSSMRLHGVGSLSAGNEPLYVIDGVPISRGSLLSYNANDFETVTILKDAAATSIYGSRAANGVVFITTKKGKSGEGSIKVGYEYGFSELALKDHLKLMNSQQLLDFQLEKGGINQPFYDAALASGVDTNWEKYYYNDSAPTKKVDLAFSGGSDNTTYYISGSYMDQEGIARRSGLEKFTVRANIDSQVKDWIRTGINIGGGFDERQTFPYGTNNLNGALGVFMNQPYYTPYDEDGNIGDRILNYDGQPTDRYTLEALMFLNQGKGSNNQFTGSYYVELTPIERLRFRTQYGVDYFNFRSTSLNPPSSPITQGVGTRSESFQQAISQTVTNTLSYQWDINHDHNFMALVGQEGTKYQSESFGVSLSGMTDDRLMLFNAGGNDLEHLSKPSMSKSAYAYLSFFGQVNYDYLGKYFLDLSLRSDESSRFGANNRRANFWSVGAMWNITNEDFMQDVEWVSNLSAKVSYGTTGNSDIGDYSHLGLVSPGYAYKGISGWGLSQVANENLGWETQSKLTAGFNAGLFNDKLTLEVDYYLRKTKDMLMSVPVPYTSGFSNISQNIGSMENSGIDITLGWTVFQNTDFNVGMTKTFNYNNNKITGLFDGLSEYIIPNTGVSYIVGKPVQFYYPEWAGVDPETGRQQWWDPNTGEKTYDYNEEALQQPLSGKPRYAPMAGGFSLNASWKKGLSFSADFAYVLDKYLINNDRFFSENPALFGGTFNQSSRVLDEWKEPGDVTKFPKFGEAMEFDSRLIEDASFLRLKNISLAYDVPKTLLGDKNPVSSVRFMVSARNLFTLTSYTGSDPEVDSNLTLGAYPNTRQYVASVQVSF